MNRFTLRWEHFGAILHDAWYVVCHVLNERQSKLFSLILEADSPAQYATQIGITLSELKEKGFDRTEVEKFCTLGALKIVEGGIVYPTNVRCVSLPTLPAHCLSAPIRVYDTFTRRCNLDCPQCCQASRPGFVESRRTLEQTKLIMRKFYDVGTMEWRFTGGEPTSCPDLAEAMAYAKSLGMAIMLNTNGCWSDTVRDAILASGVDEIIISLEGREEINDRRRNKGTFKRVMASFAAIDHYNTLAILAIDHYDFTIISKPIRVTINMTVARDNAKELNFVAHLAAEHGYNLNFVPLRPYGRAPEQMPAEMLNTAEFMEFSRNVQHVRELPEIRSSGIKIIHRNMDLFCPDYPDKSDQPYPFNYSECGALSTGFGLCPDGRVNACSFLIDEPEFVGPSMLDVTAQKAWLSPEMEWFRRAKKVGCIGCPFYMKQCEGKCRAMVLANGGRIKANKLIGKDPYCFAALMPKE